MVKVRYRSGEEKIIPVSMKKDCAINYGDGEGLQDYRGVGGMRVDYRGGMREDYRIWGGMREDHRVWEG